MADDDLTAILEEIQERYERAVSGTCSNGTSSVPRLIAALGAVLELHQRVDRGDDLPPICGTCHKGFWPCPTYLAITRKLTGKGESDERDSS